ncbi:3'(2'),5'-bisphosphate nucleotidase CysQ [Martelella alba]|uniref:3'(2'),5'-bisphosphate nucleotidase CysQ n=1 Tax=Martelella alba TaxID=2590451 RepID=A0A506UC34_9HYPH|nr:3'(2'),5'-bisphosphate nucleotidase CysQ [Martelella alba]TPW31148.1 3'(2'),5'-bisphosphate nucleotidase CysQ [Martelella alba]
MNATEHDRWLDDLALIEAAARDAGGVALGYFGQAPQTWWKNNGASPVSEADFAANRRLEALLRHARPDYGWLSEESEDDPARLSCERAFVVDPIDGTRGFLAGDKRWVVSVAVVNRGEPVAAVLFAPALDELFTACKGGPAAKNGADIACRLAGAGDMLDFAAPGNLVERLAPAMQKRIHRAGHVPSLAYRLAMVAEGRLDGTLVRTDSHDWDIAAADLILRCAGAKLVDGDGVAPRYNLADVSKETLFAGSSDLVDMLLRHFDRKPFA